MFFKKEIKQYLKVKIFRILLYYSKQINQKQIIFLCILMYLFQNNFQKIHILHKPVFEIHTYKIN